MKIEVSVHPRNHAVKQKCRHDRMLRRQKSQTDGDSRDSGQSSFWLPINRSTFKPQNHCDNSSSQESFDVPFEDLLIHSLSSIAVSARSDQADRLENLKKTMKLREGDRLRKPASHHKDLMPLDQLAMLMSTQLTNAAGKGLFGPIEPAASHRQQMGVGAHTASTKALVYYT